MIYGLLAILLLAGFIGLSLDRPDPIRQDALAASEQDLRLRVINPKVIQFDESGQRKTELIAPMASDMGPDRPAIVQQPSLDWPAKGWQAQGETGEITAETTRLIGNARAQQPELNQELLSPEISQTGDLLVAPDGQITTPDFTGQAEEVSIDTETRIIRLTQQVSTQLWPAR